MAPTPCTTGNAAARRLAAALALALAPLAAGVTAAQGPGIAVQGTGPSNTIVDVPGLKVGHFDRFGDGYRTGTTVILTERGATGGVSQLGGAPGSKETDLLEPGGLETGVHAIVLSGGSAYGLDTATGVMRWLEERGFGYPVGGGVVPIVPAAILFDLNRGGRFDARPDAEFGYRAANAATGAPTPMGRVGAGMGAGWGLGTASVRLSNGYTIGAIVALNPAGSPVDPATCIPYGAFLEVGNEFDLTAPSDAECPTAAAPQRTALAYEGGSAFNTTIAVVATDAPLSEVQATRMATISNSGLARSIRPVHNLGDGDLVFALATAGTANGPSATPPATPPAALTGAELNAIYNAAADALGRAVVHAILSSRQVGNSRKGYCEQYPSACRLRNTATVPARR